MDDVSRRAVLSAGVGAAGVVVLGLDATPASAVAKALPQRSHYRHAVGHVLTAAHGKRTYKLRLTHIHNVVGAHAAQRQHCFILVFTVVGSAHLPDAIYTLRRSGVATHRLFLSGVGQKRAMQAVVNRSR
jgi:hypothetical protein